MKRRNLLSLLPASFLTHSINSFANQFNLDNPQKNAYSEYYLVLKESGDIAVFKNNLELKTIASNGQAFNIHSNPSEKFIYDNQISLIFNHYIMFTGVDTRNQTNHFYFSKFDESSEDFFIQGSLHSDNEISEFDRPICLLFESIGPNFEYIILFQNRQTYDFKFIGFEKSTSQFRILNSISSDSFDYKIDDFTNIGKVNSEIFRIKNNVLLFQWNQQGQSYFQLEIDDSNNVNLTTLCSLSKDQILCNKNHWVFKPPVITEDPFEPIEPWDVLFSEMKHGDNETSLIFINANNQFVAVNFQNENYLPQVLAVSDFKRDENGWFFYDILENAKTQAIFCQDSHSPYFVLLSKNEAGTHFFERIPVNLTQLGQDAALFFDFDGFYPYLSFSAMPEVHENPKNIYAPSVDNTTFNFNIFKKYDENNYKKIYGYFKLDIEKKVVDAIETKTVTEKFLKEKNTKLILKLGPGTWNDVEPHRWNDAQTEFDLYLLILGAASLLGMVYFFMTRGRRQQHHVREIVRKITGPFVPLTPGLLEKSLIT